MVGRLKTFLFLFGMFLVAGCSHEKITPLTDSAGTTYGYLPENLVTYSDDKRISARYIDPVTRYDHGILGDKIEAGGLLVIRDGKEFVYRLGDGFVFEDLQPRLYDVDHDGELEMIVIQTSLSSGAACYVYKITGGQLMPFLSGDFIGIPYRWLNIAAVDDLDNDGNVEIAWIQTPHIGGVLKIARVLHDSLFILDETEGVSNHKSGSRNLCLSVTETRDGKKILHVPDNDYQAIIGFSLENNELIAMDTISIVIDPAVPLFLQYPFPNSQTGSECIYLP